MRCKGKIKNKRSNGKVIERVCNYNLSEFQIFCPQCGEPTDALSGNLSEKQNWKQVWNEFKERKAKYYPFSIFIILTAFFLIGLSVYFTRGNYWLNNIILLFIIPLTLIPFSFDKNFISYPFKIKSYFIHLKYYPQYFLFTLINILYFLLLKILCTGYLLDIETDPILHIVRLILVIYWIVIILPAPILMIRKSINPLKAIYISYKAGKETRWQQFFILIKIGFYSLLGIAIAGLGLLITIPMSYIVIEKYYLKMDEYKLFNENHKSN